MTWSLIPHIVSTLLVYLDRLTERLLITHQLSRRLDDKIVGGGYVLIDRVPHQVSVQFMKKHICGGSIIAAKWAITAAHCVCEGPVEDFRINSGSNFRYISGRNHKVKQILVHEKYDDLSEMYDIALMEIMGNFKTNARSERKINLPEADTKPPDGAIVVASGWGTILEGWNIPPISLKYVKLKIKNWARCKKTYAELDVNVTHHMICAGHTEPGQDSCQGDSGGPLVSRKILVGIVSTGYGCGARGYPGIYTCVGSFRKWIKKHAGV